MTQTMIDKVTPRMGGVPCVPRLMFSDLVCVLLLQCESQSYQLFC